MAVQAELMVKRVDLVLNRFSRDSQLLYNGRVVVTPRNGWIARQLSRLFRELGLRDVTVTPFAANIPFAVLDQFGLRKTVERAAKVGIISADEASVWWRRLEKADRDGHFFCATLTLYVKGRKP